MLDDVPSDDRDLTPPQESYYPNSFTLIVTNESNITGNAMERRIVDHAHDLATTISTAAPEERERLREMVVHLLREEVEIVSATPAVPRSGGPTNPFGIGIPLILVGAIMMILFPPVGLLLLAVAALMMVWGLAAVMTRHER